MEMEEKEIHADAGNSSAVQLDAAKEKKPLKSDAEKPPVNEKKPLIEKNFRNYFFIAFALLLLSFIAVYFLFYASPKSNYSYSIERNGVLFESNSDPAEIVKSFSSGKKIVVAVQFQESGSVNAQMANALVLMNSILPFNGITPITLAHKIEPSSREIISCITNEGDATKSVELSKEQCVEFGKNEKTILVLFPDEKLSKPEIVLEENLITVKPSSPSSAAFASRALMDLFFEGNDEALAKINELFSKATGK